MDGKVPDPESESLLPASASEPSIKPVGYTELFQGTGPRTRLYFLVGALNAIILGALFSLMFLVMGQFFDESANEDEDDYDLYEETCKLAYIWTGIGVLMVITGFVAVYCFTRLSEEVGINFRKRYLHAILGKDIGYFDLNNAAELPTQMNHDCELIEGGTGEKFMFFLETGSYIVSGLIVASMKSPQLTLVALSLAPLNVFGNGLFGYGHVKGAKIEQEAYIKAGAISEEALADLKTVAAFNAQNHVAAQYNNELEAPVQVIASMGMVKGLGAGIVRFAFTVAGGVVFWVASKWVSDERHNWIWGDDIEGPDAVTIFWTVSAISNWLGHMMPGISAYLEARMAGGRALHFIEEPVLFRNGTQTAQIAGRIEFRDVHFAYPKYPDRPVLKGLNFTCFPGQQTAIVGESGAGKSTIIQLLERFYEPSSGQILYDGVPVTDFDISNLREQVAYVSQEPVLFNLTIEDNIRIGRPEASLEDLETAAKEANAHHFVTSLSDGYQTHVGVKGSKLSGGQKQRIAIARALIKKPSVLLLDEATSALDNHSERAVLKTLNAIHRDKHMTMVSVAQKLSTISHSDQIVVLRDGQAAESGTHDSLLALNGLYAQMCSAQNMLITAEEALGNIVKHTDHRRGESLSSVGSVISVHTELEERGKMWLIVKLLKSTMSYFPLMLLGTVATCIGALTFPFYGYLLAEMMEYICGRSGGPMEDTVRKYALWSIGLAVVAFFAFFLMLWAFNLMTAQLTKRLRQDCFLKMLHLDAQFFDDRSNNSALLSQNLNSDVRQVNDAGGPLLCSILLMVVAYIVGMAIGIYWQWELGLMLAVLIPIQAFFMARAFIIRSGGVTHPQHQVAATLALDAIINVKTVTACQIQPQVEQQYSQLLNKAYEDTHRDGQINAFLYGLGTGFAMFAFAAAFWFGGFLLKEDQAGHEDVSVCIFSTHLVVVGIIIASIYAPDIAKGWHAAQRIFHILEYQPSIDSTDRTGEITDVEGHVRFDNVSFSYPGRDNLVLKRVNFDLEKGKRLGITGASGSGKTTITQLLLRFYDVTEGAILIDDVDVRSYQLHHLRESIAMVSQEPVLFSGSIRSNVDFGMQKDDSAIREALINASLPKFADDLDRSVGTRGGSISGGQKQRVAIARAILRSPKILLLDEATSALDTKTERKILQALEVAGSGRTVIVIAHRLSTIEKCEQIMVMDLGEVKEKGTHESLMGIEGGIYQRLVTSVKT